MLLVSSFYQMFKKNCAIYVNKTFLEQWTFDIISVKYIYINRFTSQISSTGLLQPTRLGWVEEVLIYY